MTVGLYFDPDLDMIVTDRWGPIRYPRPCPDPENPDGLTDVGHLILVTGELVAACLGLSQVDLYDMAYTTITVDPEGRIFMTVRASNGSWIWELHEAHWTDDCQGHPLFVGVWRD